MRPDAAIRLIREKLLREMGEEIFTVASPGHVQVDQEDLEAAEDVLAVYESKMEVDTIHEDIGKVWMDYGHYGGDPDAPTDHDTSSWSPLDDVEDDPDETLLPTYVSMKRAEESITRGVKSLTKMELRSMIREEIIDTVRSKSARRK